MKRQLGCLLASAMLMLAVGCSRIDMRHPMSFWHEKEVKVSMNEVPAPVAATIERESMDMKIEEIEKETEDGKVVYEVDLGKGELKIDAAGNVIEREGKKGMPVCVECVKKGEMCDSCKAKMKDMDKGEMKKMKHMDDDEKSEMKKMKNDKDED